MNENDKRFPFIGALVEVTQWAERQIHPDDRMVWGPGEVASESAIVTGVITKYNGRYVPSSITPDTFFNEVPEYSQARLVDRKAVKILAVRSMPESKERLAWSWRVLEFSLKDHSGVNKDER